MESKKQLRAQIKEHYFSAKLVYRLACALLVLWFAALITGGVVASLEWKDNEIRNNALFYIFLVLGIGFFITFSVFLIRSIRLSSRLMRELQDYPEKKKFLVKLEVVVRKFRFWCCLFWPCLLFGILALVSPIFIIIRFKDLEKMVKSISK